MDREMFIDNLNNARKTRNLTQKQVAEALGISDRTYSKWETGETEPGIELLCRMGEFYGMSPAEFFSDTAPEGKTSVHTEFASLTPGQAMLRLRDVMDEAFEGQSDAAIAINKRLFDPEDTEAQRIWLEPLPVETAPEDFIDDHIGFSDGYLRRCWDREVNLRLLMLPAEEGFAGLFEGAEDLTELFSLLGRAKLLLPLMDAAKERRTYDYFTSGRLAEGTGLTAEEAEKTLKAMELWGLCARHEVETGTGDYFLYTCGNMDLLWGILALARLLVRDMRDRRDDWRKRGEQA